MPTALASLRDQIAELDHIYQTVPVGLCFFDRDLRYVRINERLAEMNGKPMSEHIGRPFQEVLPELAPTLEPMLRRILESGEPILNVEVHGVTAASQDEERDWLCSYYPVKANGEGALIGISVLVHDITDRKRNKEALRYSEHKYRTLINQCPDPIFVSRIVDFVFTEVNERACANYGYTREEFLNMEIFDIETEAPLRQQVRDLYDATEVGQVVEVNGTNRRKDGSTFPIHARFTKLDDQFALAVVRDVTELKRSQEALRVSEVRFRNIFEATPVSVWEVDYSEFKAAIDDLREQGVKDFRRYVEDHPGFVERAVGMFEILDVNRETLKMFGAESKAELMQSLERILVPETMEAFREEIIAVAQGAHFFQAETVLRKLNGEKFDVLFAITCPEEESALDSVLVTLVDITHRKRAEAMLHEGYDVLEACVASRTKELNDANLALQAEVVERKCVEATLRDSEARVRIMADSVPALIAHVDANQRYLFHNAAYAMWFGRAGQNLCGLYIRDVLGEDNYARVRMHVEAALKGEPVTFDTKLEGSMKEVAQFAIDLTPDLADDGKVHGYYVLAYDITERKEAIRELQRGEKRFRQLLESAPTAVVLVSATGKIVLINEEAENLFGYERSELIGKDVETIVPSRYRGKHSSHRESYLTRPHVRRMGSGLKLHGLRKDGTEVPVEISLSPVETHEGMVVSAHIRDLSEQERAESELRRHREELAHVTRVSTMGELAASLAHEINQPLGAMVINAQSARRLLDGGPEGLDRARAALTDIAEQGKRAGKVIRSLRELLKRGERDQVLLDINEVIRNVLALVNGDAIARNVSIATRLAPDLPSVNGDPIQLQQVVLNLILNGSEAMRDTKNGDRDLVVSTIPHPKDGVEVRVRDAGVGLDPDRVEQMFDAFFTTKRDGMGMGLSINRSIVEAHGGRIWATPNPDRGATFHFTLPAAVDGT